MPQYRFRIQKDNRSTEHVDVGLADAWAARCRAVELMAGDMKEDAKQFWDDEEWHVEVADGTGMILFTVYSTAITAAAGNKH